MVCVLKMLKQWIDCPGATQLVGDICFYFRLTNPSQRVRKAPLKKPDQFLRSHPLKEIPKALEVLQKVLLIHPSPLVEKLPMKYCICNHGEGGKSGKNVFDVQCGECFTWFHVACTAIPDGVDLDSYEYQCEWCKDKPDREGFQRWRTGRKTPRKRHLDDRPIVKGVKAGDYPLEQYSSPPTWEGKVAEVKERAKRIAVQKRKLKASVQQLVDKGGHHLVDAQGLGGLVDRPVDDPLADELLQAGLVDLAPLSDDDD